MKLVKPPFTVLLELGFPISFHGGTSVKNVFQSWKVTRYGNTVSG